jgi:hypothetical protein
MEADHAQSVKPLSNRCKSDILGQVASPIQRGDALAMLTVRNRADYVQRALRTRAARHGHGTDAQVREILTSAGKLLCLAFDYRAGALRAKGHLRG